LGPVSVYSQDKSGIAINVGDVKLESVKLPRALTQMVKDHVKALDGVDDANVVIVIHEDSLDIQDQVTVSASVIITPTPGSDITRNRKKIEDIQKILRFDVEGLKDEYIVIADQNCMILNDF